MIKKLVLFAVLLFPLIAAAQVPVTPLWQMDKTKDSIGFTIPGMSGIKWIWDSRLNRIRLLQKSDTATLVVTQTALKDTLGAHGAVAGSGINFVGNTVNLGGGLTDSVYLSGNKVKFDSAQVLNAPVHGRDVVRLADSNIYVKLNPDSTITIHGKLFTLKGFRSDSASSVTQTSGNINSAFTVTNSNLNGQALQVTGSSIFNGFTEYQQAVQFDQNAEFEKDLTFNLPSSSQGRIQYYFNPSSIYSILFSPIDSALHYTHNAVSTSGNRLATIDDITGGGGTVTSVAASGSNGIGVSGSPITTSGTIALSLGNITPTSLSTVVKPSATFQTAAGTAGTDSVVVKNALGLRAISPTYYATSSSLSGYVPTSTTVAGFPLSSNVTLDALTATDATLTFSGSYDGSTAQNIGINLSNANTWASLQTFSSGISTGSLTNLTSNGFIRTNSGNGTLSVASTTGSGSVVLAGSPNLTTPNIGAASGSGLTLTKTVATTPADALLLVAGSAATSGNQQYSPGSNWQANGWGTTAGTSQALNWRAYATATQSTVPTSDFVIDFSVNGGAYANRFDLSSSGSLSINGGGGSISAGNYNGNISGLATTSTDGGVFSNRTAATSGVPVQYSPRIRVGGRVWNTTATAASNQYDFGMESRGVSGTTPTAALYFMSSLVTNTTPSFTDRMSLDNSGNLSLLTGNLTLSTAGQRLFVTEGSNGIVGQTTLVAGTKAISIAGLTTSSRAIITFVSAGGTVTTTWQYAGVCTSGTLTITALTTAGATDTTDTSTLNYMVVN